MPEIKFTAGQVARGKAAVKTEDKNRARRGTFVANLPSNPEKVKVELRDYFLAAAITGLCSNGNIIGNKDNVMDNPESLVKLASKIADEVMLRGR